MQSLTSVSLLVICFAVLGNVHAKSSDDADVSNQKACGVIPKVKVRHRSRDPGLSSFGQIPWQVAIIYAPEKLFLCSGTLISPGWVLTSSVCFLGVQSYSELEIRIGDWDLSDQDNPGETFEHFTTSVVNAVFHQDPQTGHKTRSKLGKFVLLKLKKSVQFANYPQIGPICTQSIHKRLNISSVGQCFISGWGSYKRSAPTSSTDALNDLNNDIQTSHENDDDTSEIGFDAYDNASPPKDENSIENFKHLELAIDSPIANKFPSEQYFVPDPVEDYIDEVQAEKSAVSIEGKGDTIGLDSDEFESNADFSAPFLDSIYPIEDHHETSLYKHKLKYKQGKIKGIRKLARVKKNLGMEIGGDELSQHSNKKRFARWKQYSERRRRNRKVLYSNHAKPEKATTLKLFQVDLHDDCHPVENSKVCVSPSNGHYDMFPCMADLGSPVFCYGRPEEKHHPLGKQSVVTPTSFLIGFVPATFASCDETFHESPQRNLLPISMLSTTDLIFVRATVDE